MIIRPIRTQRLRDEFCAVQTGISNFFLYSTGATWIAFDAGLNAAFARHGLKKLGIDPATVRHVFMTHSDYDHAGGLRAFPNATIYLSQAEEPMVDGRKARMLVLHNRKLPAHCTLRDREIIDVQGHTIQMISTPGHTIGSASYWVDDALLITGDALRISLDKRFTPFLPFQNMNHAEDRRSLELLRREGYLDRAQIVATAHTGVLAK